MAEQIRLGYIGRRGAGSKRYEVYTASPRQKREAISILKTRFKTVINKGTGDDGRYVLWARGAK